MPVALDKDFEAVAPDGEKGHGRTAILVCGCPLDVRPRMTQFALEAGFADIPLLFAGNEDLENPLATVFQKDPAVLPAESRMPWAVVFSGMTNKQFCVFIDKYRERMDLPVPIWGVLMPAAESWTLRRLLRNYQAEAKAFGKK